MVFEVAHQAGLVPLVAMVLLGRRLSMEWWLLALAWSVSWVADSVTHFAGGAWFVSHLWLWLQFVYVLAVFMAPSIHRAMAMSAVVLMAMSSAQLSAPGPDWLLTSGGSALILTAAWRAEGRGAALALPAFVYFGLGSIAYLWMVSRMGSPEFSPAWQTYQACRLLAFLLFVVIVIRERGRGSGE